MPYPYGGFWRRLAALIVDGLICGPVVAVILWWLSAWMLMALDPDRVIDAVVVAIKGLPPSPAERETLDVLVGSLVLQTGLSIILYWLYFAVLECSAMQATFGKLVVGVRVTDLQGQPVGFGRATLRYFSKWLSAIALGIGFLMVAFTRRKQGLHDMIAGTLVMKRAAIPPNPMARGRPGPIPDPPSPASPRLLRGQGGLQPESMQP